MDEDQLKAMLERGSRSITSRKTNCSTERRSWAGIADFCKDQTHIQDKRRSSKKAWQLTGLSQCTCQMTIPERRRIK